MKVKLTDDQWQKILPVLQTCPQSRFGAGRDVRRFLQAGLWITRSGAQWHRLPKQYGNRHDWMQYDAAGYMVNDGGQYTYDVTGRQTKSLARHLSLVLDLLNCARTGGE